MPAPFHNGMPTPLLKRRTNLRSRLEFPTVTFWQFKGHWWYSIALRRIIRRPQIRSPIHGNIIVVDRVLVSIDGSMVCAVAYYCSRRHTLHTQVPDNWFEEVKHPVLEAAVHFSQCLLPHVNVLSRSIWFLETLSAQYDLVVDFLNLPYRLPQLHL